MTAAPTILIVDDDPDYVKVLSARLQTRGYEVLTAFDGRAGLEAAQTKRPALIILDLLLPRLNGYEVCTLLKQDTRYHRIPIIIFSGKTERKDREIALSCGADAYLTKPYTTDELFQQISRLIGMPPPAAPAGPSAAEAPPAS